MHKHNTNTPTELTHLMINGQDDDDGDDNDAERRPEFARTNDKAFNKHTRAGTEHHSGTPAQWQWRAAEASTAIAAAATPDVISSVSAGAAQPKQRWHNRRVVVVVVVVVDVVVHVPDRITYTHTRTDRSTSRILHLRFGERARTSHRRSVGRSLG